MVTRQKKILAWHFTSGNKLRDGRPVPLAGKVLKHEGELRMCEVGLHASCDILDALYYSPGNMLHRVECFGEVVEHHNKLVCSERKILWSVDVAEILFKFARLCALDVIDQWPDAPDVVVRFLKTGDGSLRQRARKAAWEVTKCAARHATRETALGAASGAAWYAAHYAAWRVAHYTARDAALSAARASDDFEAARKKQAKRLLGMIRRARG